MLIFGKHRIRIRKYRDIHIKCEHCGKYGQIFSVYQEYYHFFFIPFFPVGVKAIYSCCENCNDRFNEEKINHYLNHTRTPLYIYSGFFLSAAFILFLILANITTQKQKAEYIALPQVGDVYLIRDKDSRVYYFLKVQEINRDTISLIHSALEYSGFVSEMNGSDYFIKDRRFFVIQKELLQMLEEAVINSVERNYSEVSRFNIEK